MIDGPVQAVLFTEIEAAITSDRECLVVRFRDREGNSVDIAMDSLERVGDLRRALTQLEWDLRDPELFDVGSQPWMDAGRRLDS
jgi:hypothetical protein